AELPALSLKLAANLVNLHDLLCVTRNILIGWRYGRESLSFESP
ncbi:uncharacterized protein METZ01_LOCUS516479, partial [marine metagenome]